MSQFEEEHTHLILIWSNLHSIEPTVRVLAYSINHQHFPTLFLLIKKLIMVHRLRSPIFSILRI